MHATDRGPFPTWFFFRFLPVAAALFFFCLLLLILFLFHLSLVSDLFEFVSWSFEREWDHVNTWLRCAHSKDTLEGEFQSYQIQSTADVIAKATIASFPHRSFLFPSLRVNLVLNCMNLVIYIAEVGSIPSPYLGYMEEQKS